MKAFDIFNILLIVILSVVLFIYCGKTPSDLPSPLTGFVKVTALIDSALVDSMTVFLDNISMGLRSNPCVLTDVVAGRHHVAVSKDDPDSDIDYSCSPKMAGVNENDTTEVSLALSKFAPNFTLKNLKNEDITLENFRGRVVLLVFYSLT